MRQEASPWLTSLKAFFSLEQLWMSKRLSWSRMYFNVKHSSTFPPLMTWTQSTKPFNNMMQRTPFSLPRKSVTTNWLFQNIGSRFKSLRMISFKSYTTWPLRSYKQTEASLYLQNNIWQNDYHRRNSLQTNNIKCSTSTLPKRWRKLLLGLPILKSLWYAFWITKILEV